MKTLRSAREDPPLQEVNLKVADVKAQDRGKGIVWIDPEAGRKLFLSTGDVVQISGKRSTVAIAGEPVQSDYKLRTVRMDGLTRFNAGVGLGENAKIQKIVPKNARKIVTAPVDRAIKVPGSTQSLKNSLLGRALVQGDILTPISLKRRQETVREMPNLFDWFFGDLQSGGGGGQYGLSDMQFKVISTIPKGPVRITSETVMEVRPEPTETGEGMMVVVTYDDIGGLKEEINRVREMIELPLRHPEVFNRLGVEPPKGVLLFGAPGTGKTLIARAVASESDAYFISITGPEIMSKFYGESEKRIRDLFKEAEQNSPSIIFIDELDAIAPKREEVTGEVERRVVAQILSLMDGLKSRGRVIVIGATNRENALDPAIRRPGRFDREIEMGVPDRPARKEILQIHTRGMPLSDDVALDDLAERTHGFVGADLEALCKEAAMSALRRVLPEINLEEEMIPPEILDKLVVKREDFEASLRSVEPSALREVLIEIPRVTWEDIGGLASVKQELREAIEWPLKYPESFKRLGITPPKGILLYGPPGTGKTLMAKAVANESSANFISIKGPSVLSKWVGESEKAIRETFRKARQASPSIVFLDELDAICPRRGVSADAHVTERMVTQLLTELDGLEELKDVVVIAATNRPDIIDTALIRPGRIDRQLLMTTPNQAEREEILRIHSRDMPLGPDVDLAEIARGSEGYVGSDLESVCRESAMLAIREDRDAEKVMGSHFEEALRKVGPSVTDDIMTMYRRIGGDFGRQYSREISEYTR
jgi:transitional endoplasmic reticulum ATPase